MKRCLLSLVLIILLGCSHVAATQQAFMFGVWGDADDTLLSQYTQMLSNTLHFNTVLAHCYNSSQLQVYIDADMKLISRNSWRWADTVCYWPNIYSESAYRVFESENTQIGCRELVYHGGVDSTVGATKSRYFQAVSTPVDSLIQTGPYVFGGCDYYQCGNYLPDYLKAGEDAHYRYTTTLRFKLGPRPPLATGDTVAVFYVCRYDDSGRYIPWQTDTLIHQEPIYILNSAYGNATTDFDTINVRYDYKNTVVGMKRETRFIRHINFQVRWFGARDIYIDQVKVMDFYGEQLWETSGGNDTTIAFPNLHTQAAAYYMDSPTILGWYQIDDASLTENLDNVLSTRRVDSLLGAWYPGKKGFIPGAGGVEFLSLASYSNISFQWYPIFKTLHTSSDPLDPLSLQVGWDNALPTLAVYKQLALSRGVPCYPLIQGFEGDNGVTDDSGWRRPTAGENLCQVNLALAYGADGIWYWKYYGANGSLVEYTDGLVTNDIFVDTTTTWSEIKNTIGPYIDKMGPIFASLEWKGATKYSPCPYPQYQLIDSIRCNQYSGNDLHLQVSHFVDSANTEYYMLVNRRCLPDETITGSVFLEERLARAAGASGKSPELDPFEPCPPPPCLDRWWVTDMETGNFWQCDRKPPNCECGRQFFNFSLGPGAAKLFRISESQPPAPCRHGDANRDGSIDISDAVFLITRIFGGGPAPDPSAAGDANCDGTVDISDAVFLISYIFASGATPCPGC